jgi:sarcosine oxidase subunit alpha
MTVFREGGWPGVDHDLLRLADRLHRLLPVGFYYKAFVRPRFAWALAERAIRRATGLGRLPHRPSNSRTISRHLRCDLLVVGAGTAGLGAALETARTGDRVIVCDEDAIGARVPSGPTLDEIRRLETEVRATPTATVLEQHAAIGVYEGPLVPLATDDQLVQVHPARVVVATGATEIHPVFPGNDLPGVWLGRGAAAMAARHRIPPGDRVVVAASTGEGLEHLRALVEGGVNVAAALVPGALAGKVPDGIEVIADAEITSATGRSSIRGVEVRQGGRVRTIACDALVLSLGLWPRDGLARMAVGEDVRLVGDAALRGDEPTLGRGGYVCLCEDVTLHDLEQARREGFRSAEILKRYSTATMGPCQGAMCAPAFACFARDQAGRARTADGRTTPRPPVRPVALEVLAASVHEVREKRTSLHEVHLAAGARLGWSGGWMRPFTYGDRLDEYRAVRERVSLMDVGTLGKFLIAGRDALELADRVFASRVRDLGSGRARYVVALEEAGYVADDGLLCALEGGAFSLTSTTGGAEGMDARLRDWANRLGLHVHLLDRTAELGAIVVAGPLARDLLGRLSDDALEAASIPYPGHREIEVAGIPCHAIRSGFVGELAFELHHPRPRGPELWHAIMREGETLGIRPHGLDALELLRLEKGHLYLGQDTLPDDTPAKLGLGWAVDLDKPWFVGKAALERMAASPVTRRLAGLEFSDPAAVADELRGMPLTMNGKVVGRVTSAGWSWALDRAIGLGWIRATADGFPSELRAGSSIARVVPTPFYDPGGARLRG